MKLYDQECNRSSNIEGKCWNVERFKNIKTFKFPSPLLSGIMQLT